MGGDHLTGRKWSFFVAGPGWVCRPGCGLWVSQQAGPQATAKLECLVKVCVFYQENEAFGDLGEAK